MADNLVKPVYGYEGLYTISKDGVVRSIKRKGSSGKVISQHICSGYLRVPLRKSCKQKLHLAHRLILQSFVGPADGMEAAHMNGNSLDNRLDNLKWATHSENELHKRLHRKPSNSETLNHAA